MNWLTCYLSLKEGLKPQSVRAYSTSFNTFRKYFGTKLAGEITEDDAVRFKADMLTVQNLSPVTVSARIGNYKSMYRYAVKKKIVCENPFQDVVGGPDANDNRYRFIERETVEHVLSRCEDEPIKFAIRLGRYAGLRLPSEIRFMSFSDFGKDSFLCTTIRKRDAVRYRSFTNFGRTSKE